MKRYVLDSFALIAFFEDEPGADKVAGILRDINGKKSHGFMSVINWGEIYYNTMREGGIEEAAFAAVVDLREIHWSAKAPRRDILPVGRP